MKTVDYITPRHRLYKDDVWFSRASGSSRQSLNGTRKFVLIGAAGYIAPRHMKAIKDTHGELVAILDKNDAVGVIDSYFPNAEFFTEFERFDRHVEKLQHEDGQRVDYVSICSPNYLHDAHIRFALRIGADAICEKPVVLNPWNVDALQKVSEETGKNVYVILQLRLHPTIQKLKSHADALPKGKRSNIDLTYITPRGRWYMTSWKGDVSKSGGVTTNIGIHFFDALRWIFGDVKESVVHLSGATRAAGTLELNRASVRWFLSVEERDLQCVPGSRETRAWRSITVDGQELIFSDGFTDLHTESYKAILTGGGFSLQDAKAAVEIVSQIRSAEAIGLEGNCHPMLRDKIHQGHWLGHAGNSFDDVAQLAGRLHCVYGTR